MSALTPITNSAVPSASTPLQPATKTVREEAGLSLREKKAFQDFEKMFVHMMLKEMRKTINAGSMSEKSHATKMYEEMMDEAMAEQMAASSQLGVAKDLANTLESDRLRQKLQSTESLNTTQSLAKIKV